MQTSAPTCWARRMICSTGLTVPRMFETSVKETIFVFSVMISSMFDRSSRPSSVMPNHFSFAPVRCESSCHGTMLEWCSISVVTISVSRSTR
ncbi:hypothetical protein SMICM304S_11648 [Streptomyces microflavus]